MSTYEPIIINGKTVFVPTSQPAQPIMPKAPVKGKVPYAKHVGRRKGERKRWY
ncbi:hypothetical protein [Rhizobium sp. Leaf262]|uniref:hypothetical protein n=1 Tax=Rhizobium sp. Leaf262 TaxID=1736312 RepID=UPI000AF492D9|nr:hypothetical protein [Rhizobium sp. Leaf262]